MKALGIVGSRGFSNYSIFCFVIDAYILHTPDIVFISGGAIGADRFAARYAKEKDIPIIEIIPDWDTFGKSAGFIRNTEIIELSDEVVAFWDGTSKGTLDSIKKAKKFNKPTTIVEYNLDTTCLKN